MYWESRCLSFSRYRDQFWTYLYAGFSLRATAFLDFNKCCRYSLGGLRRILWELSLQRLFVPAQDLLLLERRSSNFHKTLFFTYALIIRLLWDLSCNKSVTSLIILIELFKRRYYFEVIMEYSTSSHCFFFFLSFLLFFFADFSLPLVNIRSFIRNDHCLVSYGFFSLFYIF